MGLVKRSELMVFLNTNPSGTNPTWSLAGKKTTDSSWAYDAATTEETYVTDDVATTTIDSYAVSMEDEMRCNFGDPVYDFVNDIRYNLKTGDDAITKVLLIDKYDVTDDTFKAQVFNCSISVSNYGGAGGETPTLTYSINCNGNPTNGTATISAGVPTFTENVSA